ncbi:MAG: fibronectin type III-like domain-contianing protein, partial [Prevotella sp.]|nr:fibronectin type III-like domain-contianing protein [Prevotella sp.]
YDDLNIEETGDTQFKVTFNVTNTGDMDGDEVVQLYLHDEFASTAQPMMQLKKFSRIFIPKGETKQVSFTLEAEDLEIIDQEMNHVVETGDFTVMIGPSSDNIILKATFTQN